MFAIVHNTAPANAIRWFKTVRGAKISLAAANRNAGYVAYKIVTEAERAAADSKVDVINCLTGKPVTINESDRGGPCDPSTERYHCM